MNKIVYIPIKTTIITIIALFLLASVTGWYYRDNLNRLQHGVARGVYLDHIPVERMLKREVRAIVEEESFNRLEKPRNAYFDPRTGQLLRETYGKTIDVQATVEMIMEGEADTVYSPVELILEPEITVEIYRELTARRGSFATWYGNGGRAENIRIAASYINNYLLAPGEVFSFNHVTGHNKHGRGYQPAPIIIGDSVVPGYGGGVCQVSTTLYNAVLYAELEIVERFPHSRPVGYVPVGRDATVSGHLDFKFRNSTNDFILIKGGGGGGSVYFEIFSRPD